MLSVCIQRLNVCIQMLIVCIQVLNVCIQMLGVLQALTLSFYHIQSGALLETSPALLKI